MVLLKDIAVCQEKIPNSEENAMFQEKMINYINQTTPLRIEDQDPDPTGIEFYSVKNEVLDCLKNGEQVLYFHVSLSQYTPGKFFTFITNKAKILVYKDFETYKSFTYVDFKHDVPINIINDLYSDVLELPDVDAGIIMNMAMEKIGKYYNVLLKIED